MAGLIQKIKTILVTKNIEALIHPTNHKQSVSIASINLNIATEAVHQSFLTVPP